MRLIETGRKLGEKLHILPEKKALKGTSDIIDAAYKIALKTLRNRYSGHGIVAGSTHFADIWGRDSCFAALGSLSVGDVDVVKANLTTLLKFMSPKGQIPLRVGQKSLWLRYMGISGKVQARYKEDKGVSHPTDKNSLFLIVLHRYVELSKDTDFVIKNFTDLKKVVHWNIMMDKDKDFLIEEGPYAGWTDSIKKRGKVLYTNVLHYRAMVGFAEVGKLVGKMQVHQKYIDLSHKIKDRINEAFWNGEYYIDWIREKPHNYFSTDGNALATLFGIADKEKAKKIQMKMVEFGINEDFCTATSFPKYPHKHVSKLFYIIKLHDYHNGLKWLWLGCLDAVSKFTVGMKKESKELILNIAHKIVEHKGVYEVYHEGNPVNRLFYKSEKGFAWSSGLFVWACRELGLK